jgi:hypothetical protein
MDESLTYVIRIGFAIFAFVMGITGLLRAFRPKPTLDPGTEAQRLVADGDRFAKLGHEQYRLLVTPTNLTAFPANRAECESPARQTAELLRLAAEQYRAAALKYAEASRAAETPPPWANACMLRARAFERLAESNESLRAVTLALVDATIADSQTLEAKIAPLMQQSHEQSDECRRLLKQASTLPTGRRS